MSALAVLAVALGVLAAGEGVVLAVQSSRADRAATAAEHVCADRVAEVEGRVATCAGELGECRARVTAESIGAALAPGLTDAQARADILTSLPRAKLAEELFRVASPRVLMATDWMMRCESLLLVNNVDRLGCGSGNQAVTAYLDALNAQAACPAPSEGQAPE